MRTPAAAVFIGFLSIAAHADPQPWVLTIVKPVANSAGWHNTGTLVAFICDEASQCPANQIVETDGRDRLISAIATTTSGGEMHASVVINVDRTPPDVMITSPANGLVTAATSIAVTARATDGLSGVVSATCNGGTASVDEYGVVRCVVTLLPGVNDIIVQASDAADNTGTAGIRVTRRGPPSALRIVPEAFSVLVGKPRTIQVVDNFGTRVTDVVWQVDDWRLLEVSSDGQNMVTPKMAGTVTLTATHDTLSVRTTVKIYNAATFPSGSVQWRVQSLQHIQTRDATSPLDLGADTLVPAIERAGATRPTLWGVGQVTGRLGWIAVTGVHEHEQAYVRFPDADGGVLIVAQPVDGSPTALVHTGPPSAGAPWRYQSAGYISPSNVIQDSAGSVVAIETLKTHEPMVVMLDGRTGRVLHRLALPDGMHVVLNVGCIRGANAARVVPSEVGPPRIRADGSLMLEIVQVDDVENFEECGHISGHIRRILSAVIVNETSTMQPLHEYDVAPESPVPQITMFPVLSDGRDGQLAPWRAQLGRGGAIESHVVHFTSSSQQEYEVPVAGQIFVRPTGIGAMTDGHTLVAFDLLTGTVKWTRVYPGGGARILPGNVPNYVIALPNGVEEIEPSGRVVH